MSLLLGCAPAAWAQAPVGGGDVIALDLRSPMFWLSVFGLLGALGLGLVLGLVQYQRLRLRQRRAELLLVRRERTKLSALLNAIPDPVYFKDASGA